MTSNTILASAANQNLTFVLTLIVYMKILVYKKYKRLCFMKNEINLINTIKKKKFIIKILFLFLFSGGLDLCRNF